MPDCVRVAQGFLDRLFASDYAKAMEDFDPAMRATVPDQALATMWSQITTVFGKPLRHIGTRHSRALSGTLDIVYLTWDFEKDRIEARVIVNSAAQISGLTFETPVTR